MRQRSMNHRAEISILGGLPTEIEFSIAGPDESVGLFGTWIDDWRIIGIAGRPVGKRKIDWLYDKIAAKRGEEDRLMQKLLESTEE